MFKIATWNVNSLRVRLPQVLMWLEVVQPDILALQETKLEDKDFPRAAIQEAGYHVIYAGQKTYNGVAILSKQPIELFDIGLPGYADSQQRVLAATIGGLRVVNLYVPNGEALISAKYHYKLTWLQQLQLYLQEQMQHHAKLVVVGDFNIAPTDSDVHNPFLWQDKVLVSEPERQAWQALLNLGLSDSFRLFEQVPHSFSWWDYRAASFRRNLGLRIDHILVSPTLAEYCYRCEIDKTPRQWERPSDHAPVIASFSLS